MAVIEVNDLIKIYGKGDLSFTALKGVNLKITPGESVAILGKSGSGKSTLMHLMALLDKPTSGTILINGQDAHKLRKKDLNILRNKTFGFVFQQFFMNGNDSVLNNVILPLKIGIKTGLTSFKKRKLLALEALKAVGIEDKAKNKAVNLSGGQKQRVCIARAIVNNPSIIFADEPTGNLDSETSNLIEDLLFGMHKERNITLIIVTHDEDLAAKCDRQILLKDGVIVDSKTSSQLHKIPKSTPKSTPKSIPKSPPSSLPTPSSDTLNNADTTSKTSPDPAPRPFLNQNSAPQQADKIPTDDNTQLKDSNEGLQILFGQPPQSEGDWTK